MRPVYQQTQGRDGYGVSLEVPGLDSACILHSLRCPPDVAREVNRPNPDGQAFGTKPGILAIRTMIGEGASTST